MKQRLCLLGPTYPYRGGIAHHTTLLCETLRKKHDILFFSFSRQYPAFIFPGKSDKESITAGLRTKDVEYLLDSVNPWTWLITARHIARFRPERLIIPWWVVFWAPQVVTVATLVRRWCGAKIVLLCHNVVEHEASWLRVALSRFALARADMVVTQSRQETEKVRRLLGEKISVVTGFHPTYAPLTGTLPERGKARAELGLKGRVLLFFGFVRPYKGLDVLLDALPAVVKQHDVKLVIAGEFWKDKERYLKQIRRLGIAEYVTIFDSYIPNNEIGLYFAAADLVVQPYRSATGSGISQLAYGAQKPVVATNVGNLNEVIVDGVNGRLVPPEDSTALATALSHSLEGETLEVLTRNAATTRDRFSWDRLSDLLCEEEGLTA